MTRITAYKQFAEHGFHLAGPHYDQFTLTCPDGTVRKGLIFRREILGAANDYLREQERISKQG